MTEEQREGAASLARRRLAETRRVPDKRIRVYLAGKIARGDWRHKLAVVDLDNGEDATWEPTPMRWAHLECVGPFFIGARHGLAHGPGTHGVNTGGDIGYGVNFSPSQRETVRRCFKAIDSADVVFAWVDDPTAHGTLVEIGYAKAKSKRVVVATHPHIRSEVRDDMWFAFNAADEVINATDPVAAFESLAYHWPFKTQS